MRRTWIKLYVDQCLRGSMIEELTPPQRWMWIGLLLLAGDSSIPGLIYRRKDAGGRPIGYSNITIAETLDIDAAIFEDGLKRMIEKEKISIDGSGVITVLNWNKFQSEYQRQKPYRGSYKKDCNESDDVERDREREVDVDKEKIRDGRIQNEFDPLFKEFWKGYPKKIHKEYAREKFMILARAGKIPDLKKATKGYMDYLKDQHIKRNFKQEPLNPATFLMKNRWRDYIEFEYKPPM